MSKKLRTDAVDHLFDAILSLQNREECYTFFEDVCTVNELLSLSQRFEVAKMLRDQKTYLDIAEKTGASTATISRVNRSLNYGKDGYELVFSRMKSFQQQRQIMTMRLAFTMHILQEAVIRILMHLRHLCRIPQFQQWRIVSQRFLISRLQQMR